jgi:DNA-binding transcriptional LysR family regulator
VNIIDSGLDLAIRIETPKDSDLIYRKLAPNNLIFCATKEYLKERGSLKEPTDLKKHDLLILSIHNRCKFKNSLLKLGDFKSRKKITCEDGVFLTNMALNSRGILVRSIWDVQEQIKSGALVQVLKDSPLETFGNLYAVIPSRRYLAPRVRIFLDFILNESKGWK